jgi:chemotaxis protein MotB
MEAKLLFASGSTLVEPNGKKALIELAKVLEQEKELEVIVEGHTDTDKLVSPNHPKSNWELSVLRATSVIDIILTNSKISPKQLIAAGRSEFHPVDVNDKAKNRRIEIIISPNLVELYDIINKD